MKKISVLSLLVIVFGFCACHYQPLTLPEKTGVTETTAVITELPSTTEDIRQETTRSADVLQERVFTEENTTDVVENETTRETGNTTVGESSVTADKEETYDLSVEMPSANGTMQVEKSPDNRFIAIVHSQRNIDTDLLWAVFSVPDSGQNYVFEFFTPDNQTADNLRRVYLIDESGKITGVAAQKSGEKEGIGGIENWFCMNVLIKQIIFPEVSAEERE